jgi:predicted ArsR family transcriptional regulator
VSDTAASVAERHRALSNPTRVRVLDVVRQRGDVDAAAVAAQVGLHVNTVRAHLEMLEKVGLISSEFEERRRQGRPRRLFRSAPSSEQALPADGAYRALAQALAGSLDNADVDAARMVADAGARWGRELMRGSPTPTGGGLEHIRTELVALLDRLGFAAAPDASGRIDLHRCPFADVAREHPDVVCGLHQGILAGALEVLDFTGEVRLEPFVTPTTCSVWLGDPPRDLPGDPT